MTPHAKPVPEFFYQLRTLAVQESQFINDLLIEAQEDLDAALETLQNVEDNAKNQREVALARWGLNRLIAHFNL